jgi:prophage regulatory protein
MNTARHFNMSEFEPSARIVRMQELMTLTGLGRATVYQRLKSDPAFPKPIKLSDSNARSAPIGFVLSEVQSWIQGRMAARERVEP